MLPYSKEDIRELVENYITLTDKSGFQRALFQVYIRKQTIPLLQAILITLGILILMTWPTDYFYFQEPQIRSTYFIWRLISITGISFAILGIHYLSLIRKHLFSVVYFGVLIVISITGFLFGRIKGLETPWFYVLYVLPILTVFLLNADFLTRSITTTLVPIVYGVAFFTGGYVAQPEGELYFAYPYLDLIFNLTFSIVVISILLGHIVFYLNRNNFFQQRLVEKNRQQIKRMADHDQLTGLYNRREFDNQAEQEFERCRRYERDLSFLMIDLDHFKEINDTYGHPVGDQVLEELGSLIRRQSRTSDIAGRYGGEEFCIALPETDMDGAVTFAERIREALSRREFEGPEGEQFSVTCSIGAAEFTEDTEEHRDILKQADEALYRAKERGRDQVVRADE